MSRGDRARALGTSATARGAKSGHSLLRQRQLTTLPNHHEHIRDGALVQQELPRHPSYLGRGVEGEAPHTCRPHKQAQGSADGLWNGLGRSTAPAAGAPLCGSRRRSVRSLASPADLAKACATRSARRSAVRPQRDRWYSLADRSVCDSRARPAFSSRARHAGSDAGGAHGAVCGPHLATGIGFALGFWAWGEATGWAKSQG